MRTRYLGDSFDVVKQSLLRWLAPCGAWSAQPMFTEAVSQPDAEAFSRLLGVPLLSREVLEPNTDRAHYFESARSCRTHVFLDPDTGLRLSKVSAESALGYLFADEVVAISENRPHLLTLVFDQSLARGKERQQIQAKLSALSSRGLHGAAYVSHACFLLFGRDWGLVARAARELQERSELPSWRFVVQRAVEEEVGDVGTQRSAGAQKRAATADEVGDGEHALSSHPGSVSADLTGGAHVSDRPPWTSGPGELLQHALSLLPQDSDLHRRLAMILIDNAVELMIKTHLGLPRRVTGVALSRKNYAEIAESFPDLLDAIEKYAADRLTGIDLGDVEYFHRLRNELYHRGSGLTVERKMVGVYAEVAKLLFKNLFGFELAAPGEPDRDRIGAFFTAWVQVERCLTQWMLANRPESRGLTFPLPQSLVMPGSVEAPEDVDRLNRLRELRNRIVHQGVVPSDADVRTIQDWAQRLESAAGSAATKSDVSS